MSDIILEKVSKSYFLSENEHNLLPVLKNISLEINSGSISTFFGPNGCGKTTLLNVVAGISKIENGSIAIDGKPAEQSKISYIFQNYDNSLFPWKRALDNIAFPLELSGVSKDERRERAKNIIEELGVDVPLDNYPSQLSGGQKQLVAIARALIYEPEVLLMDEPFASLDYQTRILLQNIVLKLSHVFKPTILFVSHEIDEALFLADKMIMLSKRPAVIVEVIENNMPKPRYIEMLHTPEFIELKRKAMSTFQNIVLKGNGDEI